MVYNANIPQATDKKSVSAGRIRNNFITLNSAFGLNHTEFDGSDLTLGFHKKVTLTELNDASPLPGSAIGVVHAPTVSTTKQLAFYQGSKDYQLTPSISVQAAIVYNGNTGVTSYSFNGNITGTNTAPNPYVFKFIKDLPSNNFGLIISCNTLYDDLTTRAVWRTSQTEKQMTIFVYTKTHIGSTFTLMPASKIGNISITCFTLA